MPYGPSTGGMNTNDLLNNGPTINKRFPRSEEASTPFTGESPKPYASTNICLQTNSMDILTRPINYMKKKNISVLSSPIKIITPGHISETTLMFQNEITSTPNETIPIEDTPPFKEQTEVDHRETIDKIDINELIQEVKTRFILPGTRLQRLLGILHCYIDVLIEDDLDPSEDRLLCDLFQNLKEDTTESWNHVNTIVNILIHKPGNLLERLANTLYHRIHSQKNLYMNIWKQKTTINKRNDKIAVLFTKARFLERIYQTAYAYNTTYVSRAEKFHDQSLKSFTFNNWRNRLKEIHNIQESIDMENKGKYFKKWKNKVQSDMRTAEDQYFTTLSRSIVQRWRLKFRFRQVQKGEIQEVNLSRKKKILTLWKDQLDNLRTLEANSKSFEMGMHVGYFFNKWKTLALSSYEKICELEDLLDDHLRAKYLRIWTDALNMKYSYNEVLRKRDDILKRFFLKKMKVKLNHKTQLSIFQNNKRSLTLKRIISQWRKLLILNQKLNNYKSTNPKIKSTYFKNWTFKLKLKSYEYNREKELVRLSFQHWKYSTILQIHKANFIDEHTIPKYFDKWILKQEQNKEFESLACNASVLFTKVSFLNNWKASTEKSINLKIKSELFLKRKFFGKLVDKFKKLEKLQLISDSHYEISSTILKGYFERWYNHYHHNIESRLTERLHDFNRITESNIKFAALQVWREKYSIYLLDENDFLNLRRSYYLKKAMDQWKDRKKVCKSMQEAADVFNGIHLRHSAMAKFKSKFDRIIDLEDTLIDYQDGYDYKLLQTAMNRWNLKVLKSESYVPIVQNFQRRWTRAKLRGIFILWKHKSERPISEVLQDEDSPTRRKTIMSTPIKNPMATFGQSGGGTISRSERNRLERMESLKNRYDQIKLTIPSPTSAFKNISPIRRQQQSTLELTSLPKPKLSFSNLSRPQRRTTSYNLETETLTPSALYQEDQYDEEESVSELATPLLRRDRKIFG